MVNTDPLVDRRIQFEKAINLFLEGVCTSPKCRPFTSGAIFLLPMTALLFMHILARPHHAHKKRNKRGGAFSTGDQTFKCV